jgi:hypothetical protein
MHRICFVELQSRVIFSLFLLGGSFMSPLYLFYFLLSSPPVCPNLHYFIFLFFPFSNQKVHCRVIWQCPWRNKTVPLLQYFNYDSEDKLKEYPGWLHYLLWNYASLFSHSLAFRMQFNRMLGELNLVAVKYFVQVLYWSALCECSSEVRSREERLRP